MGGGFVDIVRFIKKYGMKSSENRQTVPCVRPPGSSIMPPRRRSAPPRVSPHRCGAGAAGIFPEVTRAEAWEYYGAPLKIVADNHSNKNRVNPDAADGINPTEGKNILPVFFFVRSDFSLFIEFSCIKEISVVY